MDRKFTYADLVSQYETGLQEAIKSKGQLPWISVNGGLQRSISTNEYYKGNNQIQLMWVHQCKNYSDSRWGTFPAWKSLGAYVKKGEKSTRIFHFNKITKDKDDGTTEIIPSRKAIDLFNADQVENAPAIPENNLPNVAERCEIAEIFVANTKADIRYGGNRAFYSKTGDYIAMPNREQFVAIGDSTATETFVSTELHEVGHWTMHVDRCNRTYEGSKRFGGKSYAMEELCAELTSVFCCAHLGIQTSIREDHLEYLHNWLQVVKQDPQAFMKAASDAQDAFDYLLSLQPKDEKDEEEHEPCTAIATM